MHQEMIGVGLQRCTRLVAVTGVGLLQLVPAEEGSFLLLAEVRSLLQEPVRDPTLADPFKIREAGVTRRKPHLIIPIGFSDAHLLPEQPLPGRCVC